MNKTIYLDFEKTIVLNTIQFDVFGEITNHVIFNIDYLLYKLVNDSKCTIILVVDEIDNIGDINVKNAVWSYLCKNKLDRYIDRSNILYRKDISYDEDIDILIRTFNDFFTWYGIDNEFTRMKNALLALEKFKENWCINTLKTMETGTVEWRCDINECSFSDGNGRCYLNRAYHKIKDSVKENNKNDERIKKYE